MRDDHIVSVILVLLCDQFLEKKKIVKEVYYLYLCGVCTYAICEYTRLSEDMVEEIIDYMNEIYN